MRQYCIYLPSIGRCGLFLSGCSVNEGRVENESIFWGVTLGLQGSVPLLSPRDHLDTRTGIWSKLTNFLRVSVVGIEDCHCTSGEDHRKSRSTPLLFVYCYDSQGLISSDRLKEADGMQGGATDLSEAWLWETEAVFLAKPRFDYGLLNIIFSFFIR